MKKELLKRILSSIILVPIVLFTIFKGSIIFNLFLILCLSVILYEWHCMRIKNKYYYSGIVFCFISFYTIYSLYHLDNNYNNFLFVLIICVSTDIGGYVFGKILKGPKLTSISPNKTFSGSIGSLVFSIVSSVIFIQSSFFSPNKPENLYIFYLIVILISLVSQTGDLIISYFKRASRINDTGKIIPGHGGLLDGTDGIIFAYPFYYLILLAGLKVF